MRTPVVSLVCLVWLATILAVCPRPSLALGVCDTAASCGNGVIDDCLNEACDDGNLVSGDGCSSLCLTVETGYQCPTPGAPCIQDFVCGDGVITAGEETCDDGNTLPGDGCSATCELETGFNCTSPGSPCSHLNVCGDGVRSPSEACDTGAADHAACIGCALVESGFSCFASRGGDLCWRNNCTDPNADPTDPDAPTVAPDCAGVCGGFAFVDDCGYCSAGTTGRIPNIDKDDCGRCFGNNRDKDACDICNGPGAVNQDACGVCFGNNATCTGCDGVLFSGVVDDACGKCGGDGTTCVGTCDAFPMSLNGTNYDICGVCGGSHTTECLYGCDSVLDSGVIEDCNGVCGGSAFLDDCGVCVFGARVANYHRDNAACGTCFGGQTGPVPNPDASTCGVDCPADDCSAGYLDACGVYNGDNSTCTSTCGDMLPVTISSEHPGACGVCGATPGPCDRDCTMAPASGANPPRVGCDGVCSSGETEDSCGVCSSVAAANGHFFTCGCFKGDSSKDICGGCVGTSAIKDNCNQCAGGNQAKDDCGVCFGNNDLLDMCGVCVGGNDCVGCDGIARSNFTQLNVCGVCGGPNVTSCGLAIRSDSGLSLVFVLLGGGALCLILVAMAVGIVIYRRRQKHFVAAYERRREQELSNAPTQEVTLVFTDIEGSTSLWEAFPSLMPKAIDVHHSVARKVLTETNGYEVKTEGDAFMIAFHKPEDALRFACRTQLLFMRQKWPQGIMDHAQCRDERDAVGNVIFRGLRVRMGIHTGHPRCKPDPKTKIMDYYGSMVNRAARVEHAASGGQVLCSGRTYEGAKEWIQDPKNDVIATFVGRNRFKGIKGEMDIWQVMPKALNTRKFRPVQSYTGGSGNKTRKKAALNAFALSANHGHTDTASSQGTTDLDSDESGDGDEDALFNPFNNFGQQARAETAYQRSGW